MVEVNEPLTTSPQWRFMFKLIDFYTWRIWWAQWGAEGSLVNNYYGKALMQIIRALVQSQECSFINYLTITSDCDTLFLFVSFYFVSLTQFLRNFCTRDLLHCKTQKGNFSNALFLMNTLSIYLTIPTHSFACKWALLFRWESFRVYNV